VSDLQTDPSSPVAPLTLRLTSLKITAAKIQQSLPEMKRNGNTVLSAILSEQLYDETSTSRAGTVLNQAEFIPGFIQQLQDEPKKVIEAFEVIRRTRESDCILTELLMDEPTIPQLHGRREFDSRSQETFLASRTLRNRGGSTSVIW